MGQIIVSAAGVQEKGGPLVGRPGWLPLQLAMPPLLSGSSL